MSYTNTDTGAHLRADETYAFWTIFVLAFVFLWLFAVAASAIGMHWRTMLPGAENAKSLVSGVSTSVHTFMSHLI
jgi:light-harvesting complex 1 beta chain